MREARFARGYWGIGGARVRRSTVRLFSARSTLGLASDPFVAHESTHFIADEYVNPCTFVGEYIRSSGWRLGRVLAGSSRGDMRNALLIPERMVYICGEYGPVPPQHSLHDSPGEPMHMDGDSNPRFLRGILTSCPLLDQHHWHLEKVEVDGVWSFNATVHTTPNYSYDNWCIEPATFSQKMHSSEYSPPIHKISFSKNLSDSQPPCSISTELDVSPSATGKNLHQPQPQPR